ncbi:MAG: GNAT family N-acetyltransferase [Gammaproteobacteria bacterium]|nr:GNAT family N-acetyltransferase [Gammaproteobacteria bacterium]
MATQSSLHIRPADQQDLESIAAIEAAVFEPDRRSTPRSLRRALGSRFQRVLVAQQGTRVVGYTIVWPYRHTWRIYNLATAPDHRRRGVAGALLAAAEAEARAAGARRLVLEARADGGLAEYYAERGFRARARLRDYYARGQDAWRMEMRLAEDADSLDSPGSGVAFRGLSR